MKTQLANVAFRDDYIRIYQNARRYMAQNGNPEQWAGKDFALDVERDIADGVLYETRNDDGVLLGVFAMLPSPDPTYAVIDGKWLTDGDYYVLHRVASSFAEGRFLERVLEYASGVCPVLRIDTHRDNLPMQKAILRNGFTYCGIITLENGDPRLAYERIRK
ncbi:MAG: GNAT family N-acetyltransferase [Clostridia bacterium]|nr:GNAT family N-acetyltransferase [Clostridia bacterium]